MVVDSVEIVVDGSLDGIMAIARRMRGLVPELGLAAVGAPRGAKIASASLIVSAGRESGHWIRVAVLW